MLVKIRTVVNFKNRGLMNPNILRLSSKESQPRRIRMRNLDDWEEKSENAVS